MGSRNAANAEQVVRFAGRHPVCEVPVRCLDTVIQSYGADGWHQQQVGDACLPNAC